jgi:hypothetical protein
MTDATIALADPDHRTAFRAATFGDVLRPERTKLRSVHRRTRGAPHQLLVLIRDDRGRLDAA